MKLHKPLWAICLIVLSLQILEAAPRNWTILETWSTVDVLDIEKRITYSTRVKPKTITTVDGEGRAVINNYNSVFTVRTENWLEQTTTTLYERATKYGRERVFRNKPSNVHVPKSSSIEYWARDELVSSDLIIDEEEVRLAEEAKLLTDREDEAIALTESEAIRREEIRLAEEIKAAEERRLLDEAEDRRLALLEAERLALLETEEEPVVVVEEEPVVVVEEEPVVVVEEEPVVVVDGVLEFDGTPTIMVSNNPSYFAALPEFSDKFNGVINQEWALSRGWTGKGSTIGILDSGVDIDNPEFAGRIKYTHDTMFGLGDVEDVKGHGTHVAGIAAASMDGSGTMGVAPDADLAIVRITNSNSYSMSSARAGLSWLVDNTDTVVANISANTSYSSAYRDSLTNQGNGIFTSDDINYGGTNYYNMEDPEQWADALKGSEMVLVVAAGNQDNLYVQNPATFASATDAEGSLLLGGKMIVAGMWNAAFNQIEGAKSGHVCKDWTGSECNDKYRTSDFYLLAPGAGINSTWYDGTYKIQSGTSMAAPVITGAVAVLHQQWPYMKGENLVQVLLQTANKAVVGYDVKTHGQGLLDLKKATEPIGGLGISTTGRTGAVSEISGSLSFAGDGTLSALSDIKAVDAIGRDYSVNLSSMKQTRDLIPVYQLNHQAGNAWSSKFVGGAQEYKGIFFNAYQTDNGFDKDTFNNITLGFDSSVFETRNPFTDQIVNKAAFTEKWTMSNSQYSPFVSFNGMFGDVNSTTTFEYSALYQPNNFYAQGGVMYSLTDFNAGLVKDVTPITSLYAMAGWSNENINLYTGIKPMIVDGTVDVRLPTSVDAEGTMNYSNYSVSMDSDPVSFVGAEYKSNLIENEFGQIHSVKMNGVVDQNQQYQIGAFYEFKF
ncbi:S8 family serine peptidase [Methylophilaceae bacterium]|nr:S8 family serine peptidase [Methylophilaceae bacterium]